MSSTLNDLTLADEVDEAVAKICEINEFLWDLNADDRRRFDSELADLRAVAATIVSSLC